VRIRSSSVREFDALQDRLLPGVSRTFALTIPQLPGALRPVVTNAYLLCRTADTIEDEVALSPDEKQEFHDRFVAVVADRESPEAFAKALEPHLSAVTLPAERELIRETPAVVAVTHGFGNRERAAIERCVRIMCDGMPRFQRHANLGGLADVRELDTYCYYVAGVVGEMLTELFCAYSPAIEARRSVLASVSTSFGQGLQMVNIIKDTWADRRRGACWLPRDVFRRAGLDLATLAGGGSAANRRALAAAFDELIALAHGHLQNAFTYTMAIPRDETGIRRFLLWALGLAVLTLRKLNGNVDFMNGQSVKVSRRMVRATVMTTSLAVKQDWVLSRLMQLTAGRLPLTIPTLGPLDAPFAVSAL
jgi:farnesyl-diphosphate farnesyltransferase